MFQILKDKLGFDMSSPAYAQRDGESDVNWNTRILKELEAYTVAPKFAEQLEELRKADPTLWQELVDFINKLKDWLKNQIGLADYEGDIMAMTKEQYISALGISVLKDPFTTAETNALVQTRTGGVIGFKYDTDVVARERFDLFKLQKIGEGSDRIVFALEDNKVLKIAKTARGLAQNMYESDYYLSSQGLTPATHEVGLNYVVKENVPRAKSADKVNTYSPESGEIVGTSTVGQMLRDLNKFSQTDFNNKTNALQDTLLTYDLGGIMDYEVLYGDFSSIRNWGYDTKTQTAVHVDGGTFGGVRMLQEYAGKTNLSDSDFREIHDKSRQLKREYQDADKYTMFQTSQEAFDTDLKPNETLPPIEFSPTKSTNKFRNEIDNFTTLLDSQVEILSLPTEQELAEIFNEIDNCE